MNITLLRTLAGFISTVIFASSKLPMLLKVYRTKDLKSYSLAHIAMSNFGNLMYWVYVLSLPVGPVWFLQAFFSLADVLMLTCYLRYQILKTAPACFSIQE